LLMHSTKLFSKTSLSTVVTIRLPLRDGSHLIDGRQLAF